MTAVRKQAINYYRGISFPWRKGANQFPQEARDDQLIKESLYQLILTGKKERIMRKDVGTNAWAYLFENNNDVLAALIRADVSSAVSRFEPRVNLDDVLVSRSGSNVWVTLIYTVKATRTPDQVTMQLPNNV